MGKTALIVDDSNTAQVVLKRMLETHELEVDTAGSAEEALEYLSGNRPDVIFMDHMMPGMDGFEAVTAIKNNPDTATIPIMMYTSQKGELYVGQARALGAVGVLPKQVEPVEVSKVLQSLRVIDTGTDRAREDPTGDSDQARHAPDLERLDQDLRLLIQDLFDQQRAVIRRDLLDSYETIASRVAHEIQAPEPESPEPAEAEPDTTRAERLQWVIAALVLVTVVLGWLYAARESSYQELQQTNLDLVRALEQEQLTVDTDADRLQMQLAGYRDAAGQAVERTLKAIEWGANQAARYDFDELPLDDGRLPMFEDMSGQLDAIGFAGTVRIESHVGDFCLVEPGPRLADPGLSLDACGQTGLTAGAAYELGSRQSVAFANFASATTRQSDGRIRFEIVSLGNSVPLLNYPASLEGLTAGDWNEIAAANNRISISLIPDDRQD